MSDIAKERDRLNNEIQLCKKLLKENIISIGSKNNQSESFIQEVGSNPLATLYLIDQLTDTFLPQNHKINTTVKGIKMGVEMVDGILASQ